MTGSSTTLPPVQLSLDVNLRDDATFDSFYTSAANQLAAAALTALSHNDASEQLLLWGAPGCGLSHLLQAVCHRAGEFHANAHYLPLPSVRAYPPDQVLDGLENCDLVCLDDIDCVAGDRVWEVAIFNLYNRLRDGGRSLVLSSHRAPTVIDIQLADLRSRLLGCVIYHLELLDDDEKVLALVARARVLGMQLPEDVAGYILKHAARDTHSLFGLLTTLDRASLQQQRKLTLPFVREVLLANG